MAELVKVVFNQNCYFNGEYRSEGDTVEVTGAEKRNLEECGYISTKEKAPKAEKVVTQSVDSTPKDRQVKTKTKK